MSQSDDTVDQMAALELDSFTKHITTPRENYPKA